MAYIKRNKLIQGFKTINHPLYNTYNNMKMRCYNENGNSYVNYGGRGIVVCERWLESFENFALDMGLKPDTTFSLERKDNDGAYEPSNCKWATRVEQANNKRVYKTSSTGHSGIRLTKSGGFQVRSKGCDREVLGVFETMKEATDARLNNVVQTKPRLSNTTGVKGINIHANGSYMVRKTVEGKRVYLGNTKTLDEAIKLYESGIKQSKKEGGQRDGKGRYITKN